MNLNDTKKKSSALALTFTTFHDKKTIISFLFCVKKNSGSVGKHSPQSLKVNWSLFLIIKPFPPFFIYLFKTT